MSYWSQYMNPAEPIKVQAATSTKLPPHQFDTDIDGNTIYGEGVLIIDGIKPEPNWLVLIKDEPISSINGIYKVQWNSILATGWKLTSAYDHHGAASVIGGTTNTGTRWLSDPFRQYP